MSSGVANIIELLSPREVIGQAIDVLRTQDHMSREVAFELLVQGPSGSHYKVREIAAEIVGQREAELAPDFPAARQSGNARQRAESTARCKRP